MSDVEKSLISDPYGSRRTVLFPPTFWKSALAAAARSSAFQRFQKMIIQIQETKELGSQVHHIAS